ncbi:hypothetical protein ACTXT7_008745 [Hymenolepis weldensis]
MDYGSYYHGTRDADHRQAVLLSTGCSLDVGGQTTTSLCVQDSFEIQFAYPHDNSPITTPTTAATVIRTSAFARNGLDNSRVKVISPQDNCEFYGLTDSYCASYWFNSRLVIGASVKILLCPIIGIKAFGRSQLELCDLSRLKLRGAHNSGRRHRKSMLLFIKATATHAQGSKRQKSYSSNDDLSIDCISSPGLEARRLARQQISDSACRRYTQAIGQSQQSELLASRPSRGSQQYSPPSRPVSLSIPSTKFDLELPSQSKRSKHHSPPSRLISSSRPSPNFDLKLPNLERSQLTLESMDTMTPEQKISTKRGEQDYVQKKTFTNWMNTYLTKANPPIRVNDLFEEIRDGIVLIRLLEILSKETLPINITADMKPAYCLSNVKTALDFLSQKKVKLVNINPVDIVEGRPKIVLGLIWVIILYFQIEEQEDMLLELLGIPKTGNRSKVTAKQALTTWVQNAFSEKLNIDIKDFGPSWRDGVAFNAIVHSIDPRLVDMRDVERRSNRENLLRAFTVAEEKLGIPKILDPEDVDVERPDEKSIMTYVAQFYKAFPEKGKPKSLNHGEKEQLQFTEFLDALQKEESQITESIQMNKNFKAAYPCLNTNCEKERQKGSRVYKRSHAACASVGAHLGLSIVSVAPLTLVGSSLGHGGGTHKKSRTRLVPLYTIPLATQLFSLPPSFFLLSFLYDHHSHSSTLILLM